MPVADDGSSQDEPEPDTGETEQMAAAVLANDE